MIALRIHEVTMLQPSNIAAKHMAVSTELRLDHNITGSNKHGKSAKDIRFTDLVKLLDSILLNAYDKSPLLTISHKGPEDMMETM